MARCYTKSSKRCANFKALKNIDKIENCFQYPKVGTAAR